MGWCIGLSGGLGLGLLISYVGFRVRDAREVSRTRPQAIRVRQFSAELQLERQLHQTVADLFAAARRGGQP